MTTVNHIIEKISQELKNVSGIVGIVLGGSRARGTHDLKSDIDIGIYYDESLGFDVNEVSGIATKLDDEHRDDLVSSLGEWGEWINGGGWLIVQGYHVDFIFRDIKRVEKVIDECLVGNVSTHYHTGHPHAFLNVMYMGEVAICNISFDPTKKIAELKAKTRPYPRALKDTIIGYFSFEASFSLMFAEDNIAKDDVSYIAGHCFRTISCLNQVLFALNEKYCINEKKAVRMIGTLAIKPEAYQKKIDRIITLISTDTEKTREAIVMLQELVHEIKVFMTAK